MCDPLKMAAIDRDQFVSVRLSQLLTWIIIPIQKDALHREESCGGHFREEYQTEEGEALRDDENFMYVAAWEYTGNPADAVLHKEDLDYENIQVKTRSYK